MSLHHSTVLLQIVYNILGNVFNTITALAQEENQKACLVLQVSSVLFDFMSGQSEIDHPLCEVSLISVLSASFYLCGCVYVYVCVGEGRGCMYVCARVHSACFSV